jgi:hypothetical protein
MITQRKLCSSMPALKVGTLPAAPVRSRTEGEGIARTGAPKNIQDTPAVPGMRSRIAPSHEFLHGAPLDDTPNTPTKSYEKPIPVHDGMSNQHEIDPIADSAKKILEDAARLGKPQKA